MRDIYIDIDNVELTIEKFKKTISQIAVMEGIIRAVLALELEE